MLVRAGAGWTPCRPTSGGFDFAAWPIVNFVGVHGGAHFDASLDALHALTPVFSAEFAVRPFIVADPDRALERITAWARDRDEHVRRLASEGCRPRLPWGERLRIIQAEPDRTLPILEALRDDPSEYVRRSVANHLGDISKDHPDRAVRVAARWWADGDAQRRALVKHGLRSLVKSGHAGALAVLGYRTDAPITVEALNATPAEVRLGETVELHIELRTIGDAPVPAMVDYVLLRPRADGRGRPARTVFKLKALELQPGGTATLTRKHRLRAVTTRKHPPGTYGIELQVNGVVRASTTFELLA